MRTSKSIVTLPVLGLMLLSVSLSAPVRAETTFKLGITTGALTLDPVATSDNASIWAQLLIFDTLVRPSDDGTRLVAGIAEDWERNADGTEFTFHLRPDAMFSDGSPVTAEDVVASLERAASEQSRWASFFEPISELEIVDEHTVKLTLDTPFTPLINNLAMFSAAIIPAEMAQSGDLPDVPTGSGPFTVEEWERGEGMTLARNPHYWENGKPHVDHVELIVIGEDNSRVLQLQAGAIDAMINVPYNQMRRLESNPDIEVGATTVFRSDFVQINTSKEPFDDRRVRLALNYAVDKQGIVDNLLYGRAEIATDAVPVMAYHDKGLEPYARDIGKAKELLAEAGLEDGFSATMLVRSGNSTAKQVAAAIQSNLAEIGVDISLQQVESGTHWTTTKEGDYELALSYATSDTIDPDQPFGFLAVNPERADAYHTRWKDEEINALYRSERQTPDGEKRGEMFRKMQNLLHEGAPYVFLYNPAATYAFRDDVDGFGILPTANWRLEDVSMTQ